jgi:hypothetical protein
MAAVQGGRWVLVITLGFGALNPKVEGGTKGQAKPSST